MKRILFLMLFPLLALTSCGPLTYTLPVEKRSGSSGNVDFEGTLPGIITLSERGDSDSALLSSLAIGMAERLEADLELDSGSIPVFSMFTDEVNLSDRSMVEYLHAAAGVEFLIVADSLHVGEFSVAEHNGRAYTGGAFLNQTTVSLPYEVRIQVFDSRQQVPVDEVTSRDIMEWTLLSDTQLSRLRAVERVDSELGESFRSLGGFLGQRYSPQWETVNKILFVYDEADWEEACRLAYLFEWEKAMDIWYEKAASPNLRKAASAAYNLSVACEILEMNDMAAQWKARYEELSKQNYKL